MKNVYVDNVKEVPNKRYKEKSPWMQASSTPKIAVQETLLFD